VLEAIILEFSLIKKHQPLYNTKEKDNKSFNYVVITDEEFPRVLTMRERTLPDVSVYRRAFGPFPEGTNLAEALKIVRRIFPFRDTCTPGAGKPCFNRQIGLCPGVCVGAISKKDYATQIRNITLFFEGKKDAVLKHLERAMHAYAKNLEFEKAHETKKSMFALNHIKDVTLIREEIREVSVRSSKHRERAYRIEAYDVAHLSGKYTVGVMTVVEEGRPKTSEYRKFKIRVASEKSDDTLHLAEILRRRLLHTEWPKPDLLVIDGGVAQYRTALRVAKEFAYKGDIVSVVKDARHKPKDILGNEEVIASYRPGILSANFESHRFAVAYHRQLRDKLPVGRDRKSKK
jgi:excinuclease UvrABC nuclease subunit